MDATSAEMNQRPPTPKRKSEEELKRLRSDVDCTLFIRRDVEESDDTEFYVVKNSFWGALEMELIVRVHLSLNTHELEEDENRNIKDLAWVMQQRVVRAHDRRDDRVTMLYLPTIPSWAKITAVYQFENRE